MVNSQSQGAAYMGDTTLPILIVDDEPQMLAALSDLLEDEYRVITTTNTSEGLRILKKEPSLAVILCDQRMPKMLGNEFLAKAKEISFATRIMITGFADMTAVVQAVNDGKIFGYVSKPWDPDGLKMVLHRAVEFYELNNHLEQERSLFHDLMENSSDAILFKDKNLNYTRINPSAARILGVATPNLAYGRSDADFLPPNLSKSHQKQEIELLRTGQPVTGLIEQMALNDRLAWLQSNKTPTRDARGKITGLVGITRDITDQKNNEQDLTLLLNVTRQVSASMKVDDALQYAINAVLEATGWDFGRAWERHEDGHWSMLADVLPVTIVEREERDGLSAFVQPPSDPDDLVVLAADSQQMQWIADQDELPRYLYSEYPEGMSKVKTAISVPVILKDSCLGVMCFYAQKVFQQEPRIVRLIESIARLLGPVLQRHRSEIALQTSERRFRTLIAEAAHGILVSRDFKPIYANKQFVRMFGFADIGEVLAMNTSLDMVQSEELNRLMDVRETLLRSPDGRSTCEVRCNTVAGDELNVLCHSARVPWDDGWATCIYLHDITEQRMAEAHLMQAQKMETIGQMTGGVAHDFNNILTVIQGNLELMAMRLAKVGDEKLTKWQGTALRATLRGADLTRRLLAFSRRQVLEPEVLDVNETIRSAKSMLDRTLREDIELVLILGSEISPIRADASQLENAIINLSINARDAMPDGGRIILETEECYLDNNYAATHSEVSPGRYVMISVSDTGMGIPNDILPRVLEPFFTTKEVGKGTGLGLAMIYGFVKQSNGHLSIYSEVDHGTTVRLFFPVMEGEAEKRVAEDPDELGDEPVTETILLVEDSEDVRDVAKAMLATLGYKVVVASNGHEAMQQLDRYPDIDVLFTDIVMPGGMNGLDVATEARKQFPDISVLYTSGYAEGALRKNSTNIEPDSEWLAKPYSQVALARKLRSVLQRQRADNKFGRMV